MRKNPVALILLITSLAVIGLFALVGLLNYSGFCIPEKRFLSDQEKILIALEYANNYPLLRVKTSDYRNTKVERIPYSGPEEILELYPECCEVHYQYKGLGDGHIPGRSFLPALFGLDGGWVTVKFDAKYYTKDREIRKTPNNPGLIHLQNCGRPN